MKSAAITLILLGLCVTNLKCQQGKVLICTGKSSYAYHLRRCEGLNQCRAAIIEVSLEKAISLMRKECGYCYNNNLPATVKKPDVKTASKQCTAITKKGTQCSRSSRSNGRCWQHGG